MTNLKKPSRITYADSGVDVRAGEEAVERIKELCAATFNPQVLTGLGAFGGFFKPDLKDIAQPVLISSTDSVGTKLKLAFMTGIHSTIGQDLVNHCLNDILVHGARGLFFLDYIGVGKLKGDIIVEVIQGMTQACRQNDVALIGGEMAELPDFYSPGEYDLVGFVVGVVDQNRIINGSRIKEADVCFGLSSSGLHTNGYTLARKVVFEIAGHKPDDYIPELGMSIAEALMKVHRCYAPLIHPLLAKHDIHGMAHITGGGIPGNLKRILPEKMSAHIDRKSWPIPPLFQYLQQAGNIDSEDIYSAFNMGIGYILVVSPAEAPAVKADLTQAGEEVFELGYIEKGDRTVRLV